MPALTLPQTCVMSFGTCQKSCVPSKNVFLLQGIHRIWLYPLYSSISSIYWSFCVISLRFDCQKLVIRLPSGAVLLGCDMVSFQNNRRRCLRSKTARTNIFQLHFDSTVIRFCTTSTSQLLLLLYIFHLT